MTSNSLHKMLFKVIALKLSDDDGFTHLPFWDGNHGTIQHAIWCQAMYQHCGEQK